MEMARLEASRRPLAVMRRRGRPLFLCVLLSLTAAAAGAGPWLDPGDALLRHDLQLLGDAGIVRAPLTSWPHAWVDIARDLEHSDAELTPALMQARTRVLRHYREAAKTDRLRGQLRVAVGSHPREFRSFAATPREEGELEAGVEWTGDIVAARLRAAVVSDPDDGRTTRFDGSHLAVLWHNWALSAGFTERWWGPGWDGSLILSNNARPIPALSVQRHRSDPFDTRWLSWLGPWQFVTTLGRLEHDRDVPDALFFGMRVNFKPTSSLEIGLSRTAQWGGEGRPEDFGTFTDLLLGRDNTGSGGINAANEPGNQLGSFDVRWLSPLFDAPYAIYGQFLGEDEAGGLPSKYIGMAGIETWGAYGARGASWRLHAEYADTAVNGFTGGDPAYGTAYRHHTYRDGYTYRGRVIGHALGGDGRMTSLGLAYVSERGRPWDLLLRHIELQRNAADAPRLVTAELGHRIVRRNHEIAFRLGIVRSEGDGVSDDEGQADVQWRWPL